MVVKLQIKVGRRTEESPLAKHFNGKGRCQVDMAVMVPVMVGDQLQSHVPCLQKIWKSRWI